MLTPKEVVGRVSSRLNRLSASLPQLNTNSKHQKDTPPPPPSRSAPQTYENPSSFDRPPSRAPPPAPQHSRTTSYSASVPRHVPAPATPPEPVLLGTPTSVEMNAHTFGGNRSRTNSLAPPIASTETTITGGSKVATSPLSSRPNSHHSEGEMAPTSRRRSWLPTIPGKQEKSKSRHASQDLETQNFGAWVNAGEAKIIYNSNLLIQGERIPELWNEGPEADTFVYLFPRESGRGPQMKVYSLALSASQPFTQLMYGDIYSGRARGKSFDGRGSLTIEDATRNLAIRNTATPPYTPRVNANDNQSTSDGSNDSIRSFAEGSKERHLYFPTGLLTSGPHFSLEETQKLVDVRNLFAFLSGQPLVATPVCPTNFRVLLSIAAYLKHFQFTNIDGSTFGEAVIASTNFLVEDLEIADVRGSLEKNLEALILGENLRSVALYNEAFAHAAGRYDSLGQINSPLWNEVSAVTHGKLERASIDLKTKTNSVDHRLTDFEFPSLFAGIGASTSSAESKIIRFGRWKAHFLYMRKQVINYYKQQHGSWPPKANPKKNNFVQGGLNRLVLRGLYTDVCGIYDYLVDRRSFTSRGLNAGDDKITDDIDPVHAALRKLLAEYDRCAPPVQPPVPFDVPLVPDVTTVEPAYYNLGPKEQNKLSTRRLKDHETSMLLARSHNLKSDHQQPFLEMYKEFEAKEARGLNAQELGEMRYGHWIFIYAVIQALPLVVMDVPDLTFTEGVESFLCQPPLGGLPWLQDFGAVKMSWYGVGGGGSVVSLPSDVVNFGVEATYRRSHCWAVAERWLSGELDDESVTVVPGQELSPLSPPPGFVGGELGLRPSVRRRERASSASVGATAPHGGRSGSRQSRQSQRNSIALGLERLPIPAGEEPHFGGTPGYAPGHNSRPGSSGTSVGKPSSRGTSPMSYSTGPGQRASSHSRLGSNPGTPSLKGSTFDDILGSMPEKGKKGKKRG